MADLLAVAWCCLDRKYVVNNLFSGQMFIGFKNIIVSLQDIRPCATSLVWMVNLNFKTLKSDRIK